PIIAPIPVDSKQPSQSSPASSNDLFEVKSLLQNFGNELVALKRQQFQYNRPYQPQNQQYQANRPPFQGNNQPRNQTTSQVTNVRPLNFQNPLAASSSRAIVPVQNNLVQDYEWCYPCSQPHNQNLCPNGVLSQALMVQSVSAPSELTNNSSTQEAADQPQAPEESTLLNWQEEDFCRLNIDSSSVAANTRSKKREMEPQPLEADLASTSQPGLQMAVDKNVGNKSLETPASHAAGKDGSPGITVPNKHFPKEDPNAQKSVIKVGAIPFTIVEQMKKTNLSVTMWDALSIPSQRNLLREALN
ncbi:hypothetical protein KI387_034111, partial [Taxus chinensis]